MNDESNELDGRLRQLLISAKPVRELPPGFAQHVWRRIEQQEEAGSGVWFELANWFFKPKIAWAALAVSLLLAGSFGAIRGLHSGEDLARERYVAAVDPSHSGH